MAAVKTRPGAWGAQIVLSFVGLFVLLWLGNAVFRYGDSDRVWPGLLDELGRGTWIALCLIVLLFLLVLAILLLFFGRQRVEEESAYVEPEGPYDPERHVGCLTCGTVFDRFEHELEEGRFACPNCGREGELKSFEPVKAHIDELECESCGLTYRAFRENSECPHCGDIQDDEPIKVGSARHGKVFPREGVQYTDDET